MSTRRQDEDKFQLRLAAYLSGPQLPQLLGQHARYVLNFPLCNTTGQNTKDGAGGPLWVRIRLPSEGFPNPLQEFLFVPNSLWLTLRFPAFIIDAGYQHGELSTQVDRLFHGQPVPQGLQGARNAW